MTKKSFFFLKEHGQRFDIIQLKKAPKQTTLNKCRSRNQDGNILKVPELDQFNLHWESDSYACRITYKIMPGMVCVMRSEHNNLPVHETQPT